MNDNINLLEPLFERAEQYGKTSLELIKLKSLYKTADFTSTLISRLLFTLVFSVFIMTLSVAVALWLGDILGKNYYGFLLITAFYGLTGIILLLAHRFIKTKVNNTFITQLLN